MALVTIPDKARGDTLTAAEFNQVLDVIKDGTLELNSAGIRIINEVGTDGQVLTSNGTTCGWEDVAAGVGDMTKAVYDANDDGTVDAADTAAALTGTQADAIVANSAKISFDSASSTRLANTSGTNTGDQDLSGYLTSSTAASTYEPIKGADDNYVTDAEKTVIGNTSGSNTGDQDLSGKQDNITLTTTGTSGAATLVGATLNIPQYTAGGGGDVVKVGTPKNNELAVWTGDGTLEGESGLSYDSTNKYLTYTANTDDNSLLIKPSTGIGLINSPYWAMRTYNTTSPADMNFRAVRTGASAYHFEISDSDGTMVMTIDNSGNLALTGTVDGIDIATDVAANTTHRGLTNNPHSVTKAQVGLTNVTDNAQLPIAGGTLTGAVVAADHGTATTAQVINAVYGTSATPPAASTTTEGTIYVQYTA